MQKLLRQDTLCYAYDWRDKPLLHVTCGESFEVETWDAGSGYFQSPQDLAVPTKRPGFNRQPPLSNPITGPIYLEGAQPGDTLVIDIEQIEVDPSSWTAVGPGRGPLGDSLRWQELSTQYTTKIFQHTPGPSGTLQDGQVQFSPQISWPITPFIGTLGVSPDREVPASIDGQGAWGGNLDIRDVAPGNQILLPIFHPGARLYLGDVHASQGDGEFTGTAAETNATVRMRLNCLVGNAPLSFMRILKPNSIITVRAGRPLEAALQGATIDMMDWLVQEHGFTQTDAYCFVSTCPDFRLNVYQMCDIGKLSFVVGAEVPLRYLSGSIS